MPYRFTVIMPVYNMERFITEAINSVVNQTFDNWQLIIVDDASSDSTVSIIEQLIVDLNNRVNEKDRILLLKNLRNSGGAFRPRLVALQDAEGEYIVELDSDDIIEPLYLEKLDKAITDSSADFATAKIVDFKTGDSLLSEKYNTNDQITGEEALFLTIDGYGISGMGAVRKKLYFSALETYGMPEGGMCADEVLTRMIFSLSSVVVFTDALYFYRKHDNSVTRNYSLRQFDRIEGQLASLRLSNIVRSEKIWKAMSMEFYHSFLAMCRLYNSFPFESKEDRNDVKARLLTMYDIIKSPRFRFVIPFLYRMLLNLRFSFFLYLIKIYDSKRR